ncbi:MAG: alpha/beta hydrolase [Bryobacteraceae bacterium]
MARRMESMFVAGPAGRLEALLEEPDGESLREAALVCHPHPQGGGTMHNKVVYRIARGLRRAGAAILRFNYRGVNLSEGVYDRGEGECDDARAALAFLRARYPDLPFTLAGFSFGSRIALRIACPDAGPWRVIAAGFPTVYKEYEWLDRCTLPKIFIQSTHDQYGPLPELHAVLAKLPEPKRLIEIEAQDHFFAGALDKLEEAVFVL